MAPVTNLPDSLSDTLRHTISTSSSGDVIVSPSTRELYNELGKKINPYSPGRPYNVAINTAPVTIERMPYIPSEGDKLINPGTARAPIAADNQHTRGTTDGGWPGIHKTETVVQQHCSYFDQDAHGIISPQDTLITCRKWG